MFSTKQLDRNDERPRFYTDPYLAHVPENLDPGHKVTQIAAFDPDLGDNGQVFYKLGAGHDNKFYIDGKGLFFLQKKKNIFMRIIQ